jgi:hypothetical protein
MPSCLVLTLASLCVEIILRKKYREYIGGLKCIPLATECLT